MKPIIRRLIVWILLIILLLMVPLIAMLYTNEVKWSVFDFIIMGTALMIVGVSYELIARRSKKILYRIAFGIGLLGALLLFWVNGAVGIIGNEGQIVNMGYTVVIATGLFGSLIAKFKPKGMSYTLYVVAIVQMLVPIIAIFVWPPPDISWSPGILKIFILNGVFAGIFITSAFLFRLAASDNEYNS